MPSWKIVPFWERDGEPIAEVEAKGKKAALAAAAKGLNGEVTTVGGYQSWEYALRVGDVMSLDPQFYTAVRGSVDDD